jgi:hypothetical protein
MMTKLDDLKLEGQTWSSLKTEVKNYVAHPNNPNNSDYIV